MNYEVIKTETIVVKELKINGLEGSAPAPYSGKRWPYSFADVVVEYDDQGGYSWKCLARRIFQEGKGLSPRIDVFADRCGDFPVHVLTEITKVVTAENPFNFA